MLGRVFAGRTQQRSLLRWQAIRRGKLTWASVKGNTETPLLEQTIPEHFAGIVRAHGDRNAVISHHQKTSLTYDELDRQSNALARGLQSIGIRKGDRVSVSLGNNIEFAVITYALFKLGAIHNPLNPSFNANQLVSALTHLDTSHLIMSTETNLARKPPRSNVELLQHIVPDLSNSRLESPLVPSLKSLILVDNSSSRVDPEPLRAATPYTSLHSSYPDTSFSPSEPLSKNDLINIQFTSGTTSTPKAACLTHRGILNNGAAIGDRLELTPTDVVVCPPPLFHCFGSILGYMATATHGSSIVFAHETFSPAAVLDAVTTHRGTALYGVATMFLAELDLLATGAASPDGLRHLRTGIASGSSVPVELTHRLTRTLHLPTLAICYGMTETSPVSCMTSPTDSPHRRATTVGRPLPNVDVRVVDPADPSVVRRVDEPGELAVAGYLVMERYWGDAARTEAAVHVDAETGRRWMRTGDEAVMDADGYVRVTGRLKDLIIRGGENVHPLELEDCLLAHPGVADVSVVGLPDERYGEVVAAFVVRAGKSETAGVEVLGAEEIRAWVREKLSGHLVPKYVFWVDDFPKTASGKIQKFKLREVGAELLKEGKGDV